MKTRFIWWLIPVVVLIVVIGEYVPAFFYFGYRIGLINDPVINGVTIKMGDGWFPKSVKYDPTKKTKGEKHATGVVLLKINGVKPGIANQMSIFPTSLPMNPNMNFGNVIEARKYPWGEATIFKREFVARALKEQKEGDWIVSIEKYNLTIHTSNISSLEEISSIKAE